MELAKLNKILDDHKEWLRTNGVKGVRADLSYANLRDANLSDANLSDADLRSANLSSANLSYANLSYANLSYANLRNADLRSANLSDADLSYANLDFSCWPLWCGSLNVHIDEKQATQQLYHLLKNVQYSKNISAKYKKELLLKTIVRKANEFHRVDECGKIER